MSTLDSLGKCQLADKVLVSVVYVFIQYKDTNYFIKLFIESYKS